MDELEKAKVRVQAKEIGTAVLTAFFTALMFRVGIGMFFSIVWGLLIAYAIRFIALQKVIDWATAKFASDNPVDDDSLRK